MDIWENCQMSKVSWEERGMFLMDGNNELKQCQICGYTPILCLCGCVQTIMHTCINEVEIKIRADTKPDVIRKWNGWNQVLDSR